MARRFTEGRGGTRHAWRAVLALAAVVLLNGIGAASAGAAVTWQNNITGSGGLALSSPEGVAVDGSKVVIADSGNNRLETSDPAGTTLAPLATGVLADPRQAVRVGSEYITGDTNNFRVAKINATSGVYDGEFGTLPPGTSWGYVRGVATNADQSQVAVADALNNAVYVFAANGSLLRTLTGTVALPLKGPEGVAFDGSGDVWVADTQNNRIVEFGPTGTGVLTAWGIGSAPDPAGGMYPTGVAVDQRSGDVWVAAYHDNEVLHYDKTGAYQSRLTDAAANDSLSSPLTLALDPPTGDLYVADQGNNRIVRYSGAGSVAPPANSPPTCGNLDEYVPHNTPAQLTVSCTDPDTGDTLQYSPVIRPHDGTLSNLSADGHWTYAPNHGFGGVDGLTFTATDNHGNASPSDGTVTIHVAGDAPPTCSDQSVGVPFATQTQITLGCSDPDPGDSQNLFWQIKKQPQNGTLLGYPDGSGRVTYLPNSDYSGPDSFTFIAQDPEGAVSQTRTVFINVGSAPAPPVYCAGYTRCHDVRISLDNLTPTSVLFRAVYPRSLSTGRCLFGAELTSGIGIAVKELHELEPSSGRPSCSVHSLAPDGTRVVDLGDGNVEFVYTVKGLKAGTTYNLALAVALWDHDVHLDRVDFQTPAYPGLATPSPARPIPQPKQDPGSGGGSKNVGITQPVYNGTPGTSGSTGVIVPGGTHSTGPAGGPGPGGPSTGGPSTGGPSTTTGQTGPNGAPPDDPNAPNAYSDGCPPLDRYGRPTTGWDDPCWSGGVHKHGATTHRRPPLHLFGFTRRPRLVVGISYLHLKLGPVALRALGRRAHNGRVRVVVYEALIHAHHTQKFNLHWVTLTLPRRYRHHR